MSQINYPAFFNGNDLTSVSGLTVLATNPYIKPKRHININEIARTSKSKATSAFYTEKTIAVRVSINRATRELLEQSLDSLTGMLHGVEKELILDQSGARRKYYATFSDGVITVEGGSHIEMTLLFTCSDRFGYDLQPTLALVVTYTASAAINFSGSAAWQAPVITVTYSALTGGTSKNVVVGNQITGQMVTITRTWTAGDVLVIDCYNATVKVNGVEVAFTGALPYFAPGDGFLTYSDTLSTRTMTGSVLYNKRWV